MLCPTDSSSRSCMVVSAVLQKLYTVLFLKQAQQMQLFSIIILATLQRLVSIAADPILHISHCTFSVT